MPERFTDSLQITVQAGKGGDGAVHFDSRKYEAFGGPDGGDGGSGGDVLLIGDKNCDNLDSLRYTKFNAVNGGPGAGGLKSGSDAPHLTIRVPLGTLAYDARTGAEIGYVIETGGELLVARGGKGGKGNPKYATGSRRTPRIAESGGEGENPTLELNWRIVADSMLVEAHETVLEEELLLPLILGKDPLEIDFELFRRKPRWLRIRGLIENHDVAYLPLVLFEDGDIEQEQLHHAYWAKHLFINLQPFGKDVEAAWSGLSRLLESITFRHVELISVSAELELPLELLKLDVENGQQPEYRMQLSDEPRRTYEQFMGQLTGGVVN